MGELEEARQPRSRLAALEKRGGSDNRGCAMRREANTDFWSGDDSTPKCLMGNQEIADRRGRMWPLVAGCLAGEALSCPRGLAGRWAALATLATGRAAGL